MTYLNFETKELAEQAGCVFIPAQVIEYIYSDGECIGKIQRVDTSGISSFGYDFAIGVYRKTDYGWHCIGMYGHSIDVFIETSKNKGGGNGAFHTNVMMQEVYNNAMDQARDVFTSQT